MIQKRFIVLLGIFLGSYLPAIAQTPVPQIVLAQERGAPTMTMLRTVSTLFPAASFVLDQDPGTYPVYFNHLLGRAYEPAHGLEFLPATEEVKILYFTQSSLPLIQLWGGRLQLGAFQSTLHTQNVPLDPLSYRRTEGFRFPRQSYPGGPSSIHLSGLSLSFHFGQGTRTGHPTQAWRYLLRIVGTVLN